MARVELNKDDQRYIREIAKDFFEQLPNENQLTVRSFFRGLDVNGDGTLTIAEILRSPLSKHYGPDFASRASQLFYFIDIDGNGSLDFQEFITLIFLYTVKVPTCRQCSCLLIRPGYTCESCLDHSPYDLCQPCYSSKAFTHMHCNLVHAYVLDGHLRRTVAKESSNQVQCVICGDYHFNNVKSALNEGQMHVIKMEDGGYSCEYCRCFFCSSCKNMFCGTEDDATPSQCVEATNACRDCGVTKPWSFDMDKLYKMMSEDEELMKKCSTCRIKVKNRTLFLEQKTTNINRQTEIQIENLKMRIQNLGYQNLQRHRMYNDIAHMWQNWDSINTMGSIK